MITREEYELLKNYRATGYRWIARDGDDECVYVYKLKPIKRGMSWGTELGCSQWSVNSGSFPYIKWEDEEPTKINDLISDYEAHQIIAGGDNVNKSELIKEIEDILDDICIYDYQLGEYEEKTIWTISSITIRKIFSAIEKYSADGVKATVPQFVADWIEEVKALKRSFKLEILFDTTEMPDDVFNWLDERYGDTDILAKAWLDGYEIEKEKLYTVELPNPNKIGNEVNVLMKNGFRQIVIKQEFGDGWKKENGFRLTEAEIKKDFEWAWQFAEEVE